MAQAAITTTAAGSMPSRTSQAELNALLCDVMPPQGCWSEALYLWLTDWTNRLIEFTDGHVELLPMPTVAHQAILQLLNRLFDAHLAPLGGFVLFAGLRVRIREDKFREPDLAALRSRSDPRNEARYWRGADVVAEVVSPDDPARDLVAKRTDYAEAGIPEYWIVDPPRGDGDRAHPRGRNLRRARRVLSRRHGDIAAAGRFRRRRDGPVRLRQRIARRSIMRNLRFALIVGALAAVPFALGGCAAETPTPAAEEAAADVASPRDPFVGTYELIGRNVKDDNGEFVPVEDFNSLGYITYSDRGYMAVNVMPLDRESFADDSNPTPEEVQVALQGYTGYYGPSPSTRTRTGAT